MVRQRRSPIAGDAARPRAGGEVSAPCTALAAHEGVRHRPEVREARRGWYGDHAAELDDPGVAPECRWPFQGRPVRRLPDVSCVER